MGGATPQARWPIGVLLASNSPARADAIYLNLLTHPVRKVRDGESVDCFWVTENAVPVNVCWGRALLMLGCSSHSRNLAAKLGDVLSRNEFRLCSVESA